MRSVPEIPAFFYGVLIRCREGEKVTESVIFRHQNNCRDQHFSAIDQIHVNFSKFSVVIRFIRLFFMSYWSAKGALLLFNSYSNFLKV